jgi:hypothetical protein
MNVVTLEISFQLYPSEEYISHLYNVSMAIVIVYDTCMVHDYILFV